MDTKEVMDLEPQLIEAMTKICEHDGFDMSLVMVTDILEEATYLLYAGSPKTLIGEAFKKDASGTHVYLPGVMSRKKQIIPPLSEAVRLSALANKQQCDFRIEAPSLNIVGGRAFCL